MPGGLRPRIVAIGLAAAALMLGSIRTSALAADEVPLHERIDQQIAAAHDGAFAEPASDAEFLRRVSLDLAGAIPASDEIRRFLDDADPGKRPRVVDRLLDSPAFARHMQNTFDVLLMERRADVHVPAAEWREYLRQSFAQNKPLDALVREILSADGFDPDERPAAKFLLDREADPNVLVRDISRIFLGMDLQCAQCHDHPLVDDYKQDYYYGIQAFLIRSFLFAGKNQPSSLAEKADGEVKFKSVFLDEPEQQTGPHVLDAASLEEPSFPEGRAYVVAPADNVRPQPRFSRRALLAERLTAETNRQFRRNLANRLWAMMFGRGLVEPLHLDHSDNPPSHPELLDILADELAAMRFDLKAFLRELALTETYQRSSELPPGTTLEDLPPESFAVALLKPLTPEQLAAAALEATGLSDLSREQFESDLAADRRLTELLAADDDRDSLRAVMREERVYEQVAGQLGRFAGLFGNLPGQPQDHAPSTVHQALFFANDGLIAGWVAPTSGNLTARVQAMSDPAAACEAIYLSVLSRRPTSEEQGEFCGYLIARGEAERPAALAEYIWALLASNEFRYNH